MSSLVERVRNKDRAVLRDAPAAGTAAVPALLGLAGNEDPRIRELALLCLVEIGGTESQPAFAKATLDDDLSVRSAALDGLQRHHGPALVPRLLEVLDKSPEPVVRQQVALVLGGIPGVDPRLIRSRYDKEGDELAREGELAAQAKLGDVDARRKFVSALHESKGRTRQRFLEYCQYLQAPWLLPGLAPLLDDWTQAIRIGVDGLPGPEYLRVCDVAVNLVASISGRKFSFQVGPGTNYPGPAIDEVRAYLAALP